ncbi:hypothetical protein ACWD4Z_22845 [Streptomyces antibioticus]
MRRVTMKTLYAGPTRSVPAGATAEFEDAEAEALVTGGYGVYEGDTRPIPESADKPLDKQTVEQLKAFAAEHQIDLGDAAKKAHILDAITTELARREAEADDDGGGA